MQTGREGSEEVAGALEEGRRQQSQLQNALAAASLRGSPGGLSKTEKQRTEELLSSSKREQTPTKKERGPVNL